MTTDGEIIAASLVAPAAFGELYVRHGPVIFRFAARRLNRQLAEDVLSETFATAFAKRARFDESWDTALPWLYGIAIREIQRHRRLEARTWSALAGTPAESMIDSITPTEQRLDARSGLHRLGDALRAMAQRDRDVLLLYAWADLDYAAIAVALDIPVGTVRSRLNRARRILQAAHTTLMTDEGDDDERPHPAPQPA